MVTVRRHSHNPDGARTRPRTSDDSIAHNISGQLSPSRDPEPVLSSTNTRDTSLASATVSREAPASPGPLVAGPPPQHEPTSTTSSPPTSPYTSERALIHSLTLPLTPTFTIPPSPPGSPRPSAAKKVSHFLELKAQGVHFNAKLAQSRALRNPSLLQSLSTFAGLDGGDVQYRSTLPVGTGAVPEGGFPTWAYWEALNKRQEDITLAKTKGRTEVQFVPGKASGSAAERVRAGLDRSNRASPNGSTSGGEGSARKTQGDQRRSRFDDKTGRRRSRSPHG